MCGQNVNVDVFVNIYESNNINYKYTVGSEARICIYGDELSYLPYLKQTVTIDSLIHKCHKYIR